MQKENLKSPQLVFHAGQDENGNMVNLDVLRIQHVLICRRSGSGKTVFFIAMLHQFIKSYTPEELKMVLMDTNQMINGMELFSDVPHMLVPPVGNDRSAVEVLRWLQDETCVLYRMFENSGVKNIAEYNRKWQEKDWVVR